MVLQEHEKKREIDKNIKKIDDKEKKGVHFANEEEDEEKAVSSDDDNDE